MPDHTVAESALESTRAEGDTASRVVAIDTGLGSELLELHVARYEPGRSQPHTLEGVQEVMYAVSGRGTLLVDGRSSELDPGTGAYVVAGETYEVDNPGPDTLLVVSAVAPQSAAAPIEGRRTVRYTDQPALPASGDREFRYLVTDEVGCTELTQFFGIIAPGRAPEHSHVYDEVIYVLEGEGVLHIDDAHEPVAAGTCIHLPPFKLHSLENSGDAPMRIVAVFHPAGDPASRAYEANE
ncbi:MAG TPA: cupin domain-containing protein [Gaiellaceae bacterium]|nr:cupin domain-containing protein [Gaiellaceae bacterium]